MKKTGNFRIKTNTQTTTTTTKSRRPKNIHFCSALIKILVIT
jgi:hypothetical protein